MTALLSLIGKHRADLTLLAVALAAAGLWVAYASTKAELTETIHRAERICAAAGSAYQPAEGKPGEACARQVARLAAFKSEAQDKTNETLLAALHAREEKQTRDAERRQARLESRLAALSAMHTAEDNIRDDQISGSWFAALNRLAGLRAPSR